MATNAAPKLFLCILFVTFLFTSDARSGTVHRTSTMSCEDKKEQNCNDNECKKACVEIKHFQVGHCTPTRGCCCYSDNRLI
ncbi:uncharacterized protein DS421_2g57320 [Arachis hypogaea]|nr:uncharacterized protein DS421_2g57320 [Arachis hypogaea]